MSWNIQKPGDYINGPLTVAGQQTLNNLLAIRGTPTFPTSGVGLELFYSPTNLNSNIYSYNRTTSAWAELFLGSSTTVFQINGLDAMRLNSTGLGIGATPDRKFCVLVADTEQAASFRAASGRLRIRPYINAAYGSAIQATNVAENALQLLTLEGVSINLNTNGGTALSLNANGAAALMGASTTASGVGITFPAAQSASTDANTLDDYEEGTWTATLKGATTDPTTPITASGRYTKVGRQVTVHVVFPGVNTTGASGRIGIEGLPFPNNATATECIAIVGFYGMATFTGSPFGQLGQGVTRIELYSSVSGSVWQDVTHSAGGTKYMWLNLTYTV